MSSGCATLHAARATSGVSPECHSARLKGAVRTAGALTEGVKNGRGRLEGPSWDSRVRPCLRHARDLYLRVHDGRYSYVHDTAAEQARCSQRKCDDTGRRAQGGYGATGSCRTKAV